jgi:NADH-quinone oxidoreductase subunit M
MDFSNLDSLPYRPLMLMLALPVIFAVIIALFPSGSNDRMSRRLALLSTILTTLISFRFIGGVFNSPGKFTAGVDMPWIESFNIHLLLGLDGLSGTLVLLTNILMVLSVMASWTAIDKRQKEFYFFLLLLQTGIIGTFLSLDLIVFYIFWELMLIPLYFLIGIFGSSNRLYATMKFFLYTMAGSVLMLIAIITLYFQAETHIGYGTFNIGVLISEVAPYIRPEMKMYLFLGFLVAFCIKVPLFPLHTWLPDAHTEAPTAGSVILAGVLLKTGVYGLLRFAIPLFPDQALLAAPALAVLSIIAIVYGALTALAQTDMKRLVAYSSVSHMGFIVLGIFAFQAEAVTGASLQMLAHGISTGGLFLCVGYIYERRHTREMAQFGGLAHNMKIYAVLTMIIVLSSVGLPGLNGFVGEFMILIGTYKTSWVWAACASSGVILAACYLLQMMQNTFFGELKREENKVLKDLNLREAFTLIVLCVLAFWMGIYPKPFINALEPSSMNVVTRVEKSRELLGMQDPKNDIVTALQNH